jgi:hypothetical protein
MKYQLCQGRQNDNSLKVCYLLIFFIRLSDKERLKLLIGGTKKMLLNDFLKFRVTRNTSFPHINQPN